MGRGPPVFDPNPQLLSAEARPAMDETRPVIGPNLAENEELCKAVAQYISTEFFYPYWLQSSRYLDIWNRIDNMWRATVSLNQLDLGIVQRQSGANDNQAQNGGFGTQNPFVNWQAKTSPAAAHKQMDAITTLGCALSFENGELPYQARKPKTVYENPAYNPVEQSVRAANEEFRRQADEIDLKTKYRIGFGNFVKYGHSWALRDFTRQLETIECRHVLPPDPMMVSAALLQLRQYYRYPENRYEMDEYGRQVVVFLKTVPKALRTNYIPLDVSSVYVDDLIPLPIDRQPCPIVKLFITRWELESNPYDQLGNPFGWVNIEKALDDNTHQWVLSQTEEQELRNRLMKRWGANSFPGIQRPENTIQTLWTAYAMLAIGPDGKLYTKVGDGPDCQHCGASGRMADEMGMEVRCQACAGRGKVAVKSQRYVVQMFGDIFLGGVTVLRIQRNPTAKDKVPILFASHLVEDTATLRPVSKSEIAISAYEQLATTYNQFHDSKSRTINRGFYKRIDSLAYNVNCNQPGVTIPFEGGDPEAEVRRVDSNTFDETATLIPMAEMMEGEVVAVYGANPTVLGEISMGRRAASEITLADEGSKRPLIQMIDQFNKGHMGGLGQAQLDDIEAWSDRDDMIRRTGGSGTWGKVDIFSAVGDEMLTAQSAIGQMRYIMETFGNMPALQMVVPKVAGVMMETMKLDIDLDDIDQGMRKAQQTAFEILYDILGEGIPMIPREDDPDEIYLGVFKGCYDEIMRAMQSGKPNRWLEKAPQNVMLLEQRIQLQEMQLQKKMMIQQAMMMQQQEQQMAMEAKYNPKQGNGNEPKRPTSPSKTPGQDRQKTGA